ncbi:MAG: ROK family protein [Beijerinckiaceae bacterium]
MKPLPHPCLVADIGGTNARFAVVLKPGDALSPMVTLPTGQHGQFADTVREATALLQCPAPHSLLVAVAGPVQGRTATLTNAVTHDGPLHIDGPDLARSLGLKQGLLLNDFEALCLALPVLSGADLMPIGPINPEAKGPMVVVGPGTGLGVGALLDQNGVFQPIASEAGHMTAGAETAEDLALWPHLGDAPVSFEDLLSGRGLSRLYGAMTVKGRYPRQEMSPPHIIENALNGSDHAAVETIDYSLSLLARLAGDMALAFCATGGVFIGGGIVPRIRSLINPSAFRAAFERKSHVSAFLKPISTQLIVAPDAALQGLAATAARPDGYKLEYTRRFWVG